MLARWKGSQISPIIIRGRVNYVSDTEVQFAGAKIRQQTTLGRFRKQKLALGRHPLAVESETAHSLFTVSGECQFASAHFQFKGLPCLPSKTFG